MLFLELGLRSSAPYTLQNFAFSLQLPEQTLLPLSMEGLIFPGNPLLSPCLVTRGTCTAPWQGVCKPLMAQTVKNPPAVQETQVPSLGWEDPLEKEMATHSSTLAWEMPWTEESGG